MDGQREQRALVDEPMAGVGGPACNDGKPCYYAHLPAARAPKDATYPLHGRAQHLNPDVRVGGRQWRISVARWGGRCWRGRRQRHRGHGRRGGLGRWWWRWRHSVGLHDRHWWWRRWRQSTHRALHLNEPPATRQSRRARAAASPCSLAAVNEGWPQQSACCRAGAPRPCQWGRRFEPHVRGSCLLHARMHTLCSAAAP